tara:strand:+ start:3944 stop:4960 length:1017 start_codon:yes stop_codon:yes gene_type:complete
MFFASDNGAPVAPQIMAAIAAANEGYALSYGLDPRTLALRDQIRTVFEAPRAEVILLTTGTAANALALASHCPPWGAIYCHAEAHVALDECGAPEFFSGGGKLHLLDGAHGKIAPETLQTALEAADRSVHSVQPATLSLTNVTEAGTVYHACEVAALAAIARAHSLPVHLDGARLANALAATRACPADMTWRAGVDVLSLGGTKNGLMAAEAVVLFNPAKARELELRRKRAGHLGSKIRFVAAQFEAWFQGGLWLDLARQSNAMGTYLADGLRDLPGVTLHHEVEANMVFANLPAVMHARASASGAVYAAGADGRCRLVTSWSTTKAEVDRFLTVLRG